MRSKALFSLAVILAALCATMAYAQENFIMLLMGEQKSLEIPGLNRVAVANPDVADVKVIQGTNKILVIGMSPGITTISVWNRAGEEVTFTVKVLAKDPKEIKKEVMELIGEVEGVNIHIVGDRVIIDGEVFRDRDLERCRKVQELYPNQVALFADFTKAYIQMQRMILLDLSFYQVYKEDILRMGLNWNDLLNAGSLAIEYQQLVDGGPPYMAQPQRTINPDGSVTELMPFSQSEAGGYLTYKNTFNPIKLNSDDNRIRLLQNHQITVKSGQEIEYQLGGEIPYTITTGLGIANIEYKPYGTLLKIKPEIDKINNIDMKVESEFSALDFANEVQGNPALETMRTNTFVNLKSDQTLMLAGFLTKRISRAIDGIPGFNKIPLLGYLFGSKDFREGRSDGVLFITPTIIKAVEEQREDPKIKGVLDNFEEADFKL